MPTTKITREIPKQGLNWDQLVPGQAYVGEHSGSVYLIVESHHEDNSVEKVAIILGGGDCSRPSNSAYAQGGLFTEFTGKVLMEF